MKAIHLFGTSISAHQILAGGYDVVVCSYEYAEANIRARQKYQDRIESWRLARDPSVMRPKRPTTALASGLYDLAKIPFKCGYQDEAHLIKNRDGVRHQAVMKLPVKSWVMISGTLPHNRWHDVSGYLDFIKGHPFTTESAFKRQFSTMDYDSYAKPTGAQIALLQRFMQAFTIMRPGDILKLPDCIRVAFPVRLSSAHSSVVLSMTELYRKIAGMNDDTGEFEDASALGMAIRAQVYTLHPLLASANLKARGDEAYTPDDEDLRNTTAACANALRKKEDPKAHEKRQLWLKELATWGDKKIFDSPHVCKLSSLLTHLIDEQPQDKIVIFSQFLQYLDIIDKAMQSRGIKCLRFDGTVSRTSRDKIQREFETNPKTHILLITAGPGGVGLNLTSANIVVQAEEWWSSSAEHQAISRVQRQGQKKTVMVIKLHVENSAIDAVISRVRRTKVNINGKLLAKLLHTHEEGPPVVELI